MQSSNTRALLFALLGLCLVGFRLAADGGRPAPNLLPNTAFLVQSAGPGFPDNWGFWTDLGLRIPGWGPDNFNLDDSTPPPVPGVRTLRLNFPPADRLFPPPGRKSLFFALGHTPLPAKGVGPRTLSVYAKAARPGTVLQFVHPGSGTKASFTLGTAWKRVQFTGEDRDSIAELSFGLPNPDSCVWLAAPQLEEGNIATTYRPNSREVLSPHPPAAPPKTPTAKSRRISRPPLLDGRLDDPCWRKATQLAAFLRLPERSDARPATAVRIAHDDTALYFGIRCAEPEMARLKAACRTHDGSVYTDDCVEIFLSPTPDAATYYHFAVNTLNTHWDAMNLAQKRWNPEWTSAVQLDADGWTVEIAIPFASLPLGDAASPWRLSVGRTRYVDLPQPEISSWAGAPYHDRAGFGQLRGIADRDLATHRWKLANLKFDRIAGRLSGIVTQRPAQIRDVQIVAKFPGPLGPAPFPAALPDRPAPCAFSVPARPMLPGTQTDTVTLELVSAEGASLARLPYDLPQRTGSYVAAEPLSLVTEFDYYTSEPVARCRIAWNRPDPTVVGVRLLDTEGLPVPDPAVAVNLAGGETRDIDLPLAGLPPGTYTVEASTADGANRLVAGGILVKRPPSATEVKIDRFTRSLRVDGQPFFPAFLPSPVGRLGDYAFADLRNGGFNTITAQLGEPLSIAAILDQGVTPEMATRVRRQLDRLQAQGLRLFWPFSWDFADWKTQTDTTHSDIHRLAKVYRRIVEAFKDHPVIVGWYLMDEPDVRNWTEKYGYSEADLAVLREVVRAADPYRPAFVNTNGSWSGAPYGGFDSTDMIWHDDYSISAPPFDLARLVPTVRMVNSGRAASLPSVEWISGSYGPPEVVAAPRPEAIRVHAWLLFVHGTRGIGYWSTHPVLPAAWEEMRRFNTEARRLAEGPLAQSDVRLVEQAVVGKHVHYALWQAGPKAYLIAINTSAQPAPFSLDLGALLPRRIAAARRLFAPDSLGFSAGILLDTLPPYQRGVYEFDLEQTH